MRLTLGQLAETRLPQSLGLCAGDVPGVASYVNEATLKLINTGSETGWWLGWDKVVFPITREDPYITLPAQYSRAINLDLCGGPIRIQNQFYEVIVDGGGLRRDCHNSCGAIETLDRGTVPVMVDVPANSFLRLYLTDGRDVGKRVLFSQAKDANDLGIYSTSGVNQVDGFYLTLASPFVTCSYVVKSFLAVVKDVTFGDVVLKAVDTTSGVETLLARYTPAETNPAYRRYMLAGVPNCCCANGVRCEPPETPRVTALCKIDYRPVKNPSDQLLISNVIALKAACRSIYYSEIGTQQNANLAEIQWREAVKALNQELRTEEGNEFPAIAVAMPWGNYRNDPMQVGWGAI